MMPMRKSDYPKNWDEITARIRERAGDKCEQCGVPNHVFAYRKAGTDEYTLDPFDDRDGFSLEGTYIRLTVHHIGTPYPDGSPGDKSDKMDCRDENLIALCQRCHLLAGMSTYQANRRKTLARKKDEKRKAEGQLELL